MKLKTYLHCLRCKNFLKCKRKFDPSTEVIYSSMHIVDHIAMFGSPLKCVKPLDSDNK